MPVPTISISQRWLIVVSTVIIILLSTVLLPHAAQAQTACRLPARLQVGDAVEVIDGAANNLRAGPGLAYARLPQRMVPGDVWYVQAGPVCADGIHWYQVAAYDFAAWTAEGQPDRGYYLGRTDRLPNHGGSAAVCASERLSVGMRVMVGDQQRQHVRQAASKNAPHNAWLYPGVPVTILDGPRCAGGWVWWYIRDDSGRMEGWTSEGDGPAQPWLVPTGGSGSGGSSGGSATPTAQPEAAAVRPTFTGSVATSWTLTPANHQTIFSPDREAVTVIFGDFEVRALAGAAQARRMESLAMPVRSGPRGYTATATLLGLVDCSDGGRATLTLQIGSATRTVTCQDADSAQVMVQTALPANADLRIVITAQVWSAGAQPSVTVDMLDIGLIAR